MLCHWAVSPASSLWLGHMLCLPAGSPASWFWLRFAVLLCSVVVSIFAICISLGKCLFNFFTYLSMDRFMFQSSLYVSITKYSICKYFLLFCELSFRSVDDFDSQSLNCDEAQCVSFVFPGKHHPVHPQSFSPMFVCFFNSTFS